MRRRRHLVRSRCLVVLLLGLILPCASAAAGPREEIETALRGGRVVVLVVSSPRPSDPVDEAYADWAAYLNRFSSRADPAIKIVKTTAAQYRRIVAAPPLATDFATLFIRDPEHALQYDGMILEPQIYLLGQDYVLRRADVESHTGYGLRQMALQLR
jgi:hypothetical protein